MNGDRSLSAGSVIIGMPAPGAKLRMRAPGLRNISTASYVYACTYMSRGYGRQGFKLNQDAATGTVLHFLDGTQGKRALSVPLHFPAPLDDDDGEFAYGVGGGPGESGKRRKGTLINTD